MAFDIIVFDQNGLENAIKSGIVSIGLCDNRFTLPLTGDVTYTAIGKVSARINASREEFESLGIVCEGFKPKLLKKKAKRQPASVLHRPSSSYASSYLTSYKYGTSYLTSYRYETSYLTSYSYASYLSSYTYETSYITSYTYEYETSFSVSFITSFASSLSSYLESFYPECVVKEECVLVNGYGINLI